MRDGLLLVIAVTIIVIPPRLAGAQVSSTADGEASTAQDGEVDHVPADPSVHMAMAGFVLSSLSGSAISIAMSMYPGAFEGSVESLVFPTAYNTWIATYLTGIALLQSASMKIDTSMPPDGIGKSLRTAGWVFYGLVSTSMTLMLLSLTGAEVLMVVGLSVGSIISLPSVIVSTVAAARSCRKLGARYSSHESRGVVILPVPMLFQNGFGIGISLVM